MMALQDRSPDKQEDRLIRAWRTALRAHSRPRSSDIEKLLRVYGRDLRQIWNTYNLERRRIGRLPISDAKSLVPYLMGFHMPNLFRTLASLRRADPTPIPQIWLKSCKKIRVVDWGCGSGSMSQAIGLWLQQMGAAPHDIRFELIDRSPPLLSAAASMLKELFECEVQTGKFNIGSEGLINVWRKILNKSDELLIHALGYVWNEIGENTSAQKFLIKVLSESARLNRPSILALTEPAAEASARRAMKLRDELARVGWTIVYPCPQIQFCPMTTRDWCYSEYTHNPPKELQRIEKFLGIKRRVLGASSFIAMNAAAVKLDFFKVAVSRDHVLVGKPKVADHTETLMCTRSGIRKRNITTKQLRGSLIVSN